MSGTGRHASSASSAAAWRGLLPGAGAGYPAGHPAGHPARRLGVTALVAAAVAITGIGAAVAAAGPGARSAGGLVFGARLTGEVGPGQAGGIGHQERHGADHPPIGVKQMLDSLGEERTDRAFEVLSRLAAVMAKVTGKDSAAIGAGRPFGPRDGGNNGHGTFLAKSS